MTIAVVNRTQRLRTLENEIRKAAEQIQSNGLEIGRRLCEIRDDELWKEEECESWNQYLQENAKQLVGKSFVQAALLIRASEIAKRLPSSIDVNTTLTHSHIVEIGRLAPIIGKGEKGQSGGAEKDYSALRKQDVARVLKAATELAGGDPPSVREIRKAVDADLGIDRSAKTKETKKKTDNGIDLTQYLNDKIGTIQGIYTALKTNISRESWTQFIDNNPQLVKRFTTACKSLTELFGKD